MFNRSAQWYDAFYAGLDYEADAHHVIELVHTRHPQARTMLDVACGTGRHLSFLRDNFDCEGVDIEPAMIAVAATRLPGVPLAVGDMTQIDLGRRFDVVTCLFSSIGYVATVDRLDLAVRAMVRHLNPGGVLIIEPWILPEHWLDPGLNTCEHIDEQDATLVRVISSVRLDTITTLQIHYAHASRGQIHTDDETHTLGLFSREQYLSACGKYRVAADWHDPGLRGRGLVIGKLTA
jgi:SAM-dependent methyltransferase